MRRKGAVETGQRLRVAIELLQGDAAQEQRVERVGLEDQGAIGRREHVFGPVEPAEDLGVVDDRLRRDRIGFQRSPDQVERRDVVAALVGNHRQPMQRMGVGGIDGEDALVDLLGVRRPALHFEFEALPDVWQQVRLAVFLAEGLGHRASTSGCDAPS